MMGSFADDVPAATVRQVSSALLMVKAHRHWWSSLYHFWLLQSAILYLNQYARPPTKAKHTTQKLLMQFKASAIS